MPELLPVEVATPLDDAQRAQRVFSGQVLIHRDVPEMHRLIDHVDALACLHLDHDPRTAHTRIAPGEYRQRVALLQRAFASDAACAAAILDLLQALGLDPARTWRDRLYLRLLPPGDTHLGGPLRRTPPHRDTWGSNLPAQVNWWAPIHSLERERTLVFYPRYWDEPIPNDSAHWRFEEAREARRRALADGVEPSYPSAPRPTVAVDPVDALPVLPQPGDVLCFSGAHLHAGVANTSDRCRFSFETRTLAATDLAAGRGAPNVDGHGCERHWSWFARRLDGREGAPPAAIDEA